MKQQIDIYSKITLQVPTKFDVEVIKETFNSKIKSTFSNDHPLLNSKTSMERVRHEIITLSEEAEIYGIEKKYIFIVLKTKDGQREYKHKFLSTISADIDENEFANMTCKNFWDNDDKEEEDDGYYFHGNEIHTSVFTVREISKFEYETLKKFI